MKSLRLFALLSSCTVLSGCGLGDFLSELEELEINIKNFAPLIQQTDPTTVVISGAVARGDTVILQQNVTVIVDISTQLVITELPNITLLGFENLTSFDIYLRYRVDGVEQAVFVLQGETLLLEYPCLADIELLTEDDFDIVTGDFIDSFDLTGNYLSNPDDYICGEAVLFSIDDFGVATSFDRIDLTP